MKSLFTNKLLMTAPPGSWIVLHSYFLDYRQAEDQHYVGILEIDKHEHKRLILHFKAQLFLLLFKESTLLNVSHTSRL